jgi:hypothetical protein
MQNSLQTNLELPKKYFHELHADRIISFSSQYGKENSIIYTATNLTKPSHYCKYPAYGDFESCFLLVSEFNFNLPVISRYIV